MDRSDGKGQRGDKEGGWEEGSLERMSSYGGLEGGGAGVGEGGRTFMKGT